MPYKTIKDLPEGVRNHLPERAQEIYLEVFNHAWTEYADKDNRETIAHKVAWSVIKKKYRKQGDMWVEI